MSLTDDPTDPDIKRGAGDESPVPQNTKYLVLPAAERARGFIRPYRETYEHVGRRVCGKRMMTPSPTGTYVCPDEPDHEGKCSSWVPVHSEAAAVRAEMQHVLGGCGGVTTMGRELSETYARQPSFYGATYCCACRMHRPVAEFTWTLDGDRVGS